MSDPISPSPDGAVRLVHVTPTVEGTDQVLADDELAGTDLYTTRHLAGDRLVQIDHVSAGETRLVQYFDREWPDGELLRRHRDRYGATPFEVLSPSAAVDGRILQSVYRGDAAGVLVEVAELELDGRGELLGETRSLPDGTLIERVEYVYDSGELVNTRTIGPDGTVLDESDL